VASERRHDENLVAEYAADIHSAGWDRQHRGGPYAAMNAGLEHAHAATTTHVLNSDDRCWIQSLGLCRVLTGRGNRKGAKVLITSSALLPETDRQLQKPMAS